MKWCNHKLVTFSLVYSIAGGFIASLSAMVGSVLPDVLEMRGIIPHRTITHYIWVWVGLSLFLWLCLDKQAFYSLPLYCSFFVVAGGLLHVGEDALSKGGVPLITPFGSRWGLGVYRTNDLSEVGTVLGLTTLFLGFAWWRGFFEPEYLRQQLQILVRVAGRMFQE